MLLYQHKSIFIFLSELVDGVKNGFYAYRMILSPTISRAIDYIMAHLETDCSLDDVARFSGYSKFYFSRLFKAETGETVYAFIRRLRIEQCAFRLKTEQDRSITDISVDYGYSSSNFSTLFLSLEHETPYYFRKGIVKRSFEHPFFHGEVNHLESYESCCKKITIETFPDYFVIAERHIGSYHDLAAQWCQFMKTYNAYYVSGRLLFERTFDDPSISRNQRCIYDICMEVDRDCPLPNTIVLSGGKCAVYHFRGSHRQIFAAYQNLFTVWIPHQGARIDNRWGFDIYRMVNEDASYMEIDLCIPLR
jgi:AraC family transcriptional regulator